MNDNDIQANIWNLPTADTDGFNLLSHPYPITIIVTAIMFLLSHKVNFCYHRVSTQLYIVLFIICIVSCVCLICMHHVMQNAYFALQYWEACSSVHNMHSKWLDVGTTIAAFHMQSKAYEHIRPISFGDRPQSNNLLLRNMDEHPATNITNTTTENGIDNEPSRKDSNLKRFLHRTIRRRRGKKKDINNATAEELVSINASSSQHREELPYPNYKNDKSNSSTNLVARWSSKDGISDVTPSLFLQQAVHLVSLLSAVALSTLRCNEEDESTTLVEFKPGRHWPNYNSDNDPDMKQYGYRRGRGFVATIKYMFDVSRTKRERSTYNAARPLGVIGGVSERELMLQRARGSTAKTALVYFWLNEFIIREQLHGSLGNVGPPIVSRLQQYISEGHFWYV